MTLPVPTSSSVTVAGPLLRLRGIRKSYGPVRALRGADLDVAAGEVHALVGDNGAGKSTLIKVISGSEHADAGQIEFGGRPVRLHSPAAAAGLGIATVYQDLALCENLDVVANLFLGREFSARPLAGPLRRLSEPQMHRRAQQTLDMLSIRIPSLRTPVGALSGGQRQAVAVGRAVLWGSRLLLLDEPTAALGVEQTAQVLRLIREVAARGLAVLVISHSLPDVFSVADRISVLRLGANAGTFDRRTTSPQTVVGAITGGLWIEGAM
jgi:D-xylose transport system ATP-binding protein